MGRINLETAIRHGLMAWFGVVLVATAGASSVQQPARLLKDVNATSQTIDYPSYPSGFVALGSDVYFRGCDPWNGCELWKTDGTVSGTRLVKDIRPGSDSSKIYFMTELGGALYFAADDGVNGAELWTSDGTVEGTKLFKDICPGSCTSGSQDYDGASYAYPPDVGPGPLVRVGDLLYFTADDGTSGEELWKTDGAAAGTVQIKDINPGSGSSRPLHYNGYSSDLVNINGTVYFRAFDIEHGFEMWKSDGTENGTVLLKDIAPGNEWSTFEGDLANVNGTLFFNACDGTSGEELWKSDGTAAGTTQVKDLYPGGGSCPYDNASMPHGLTAYNDALVFLAHDSATTSGLWVSDGTEAGTQLVKRFPSYWYSVYPIRVVGSTLFFGLTTQENGHELWKTDGTPDGTVLLKDINPGSASGLGGFITENGGLLYFFASDGIDSGMWQTDGAAEGTVPVPVLKPSELTVINNRFYFSDNGLWASDGTEAGTVRLSRVIEYGNGSKPFYADANGKMFFSAQDGVNGRELWKSDGTEVGTVLVKDLNPGPTYPWESDDSYINALTNLNGSLYFNASGSNFSGREIWKSDGTTEGTQVVKDICPGSCSSADVSFINPDPYGVSVEFQEDLSPMTQACGTLYFGASGGEYRGLFKSNGTADGTIAIKKNIGTSYLTALGSTLYFQSCDSNGCALWKSDGTEAGTRVVRQFSIGEGYYYFTPSFLTKVNGILFFIANDGIHGDELWKSDGTSTGTVLVKDIRPDGHAFLPRYNPNFTEINDTLFFTVNDGVHGEELWKSDGTEAGTTMVKDITPGSSSAPYLSHLTAIDSKLFFTAFGDSGTAGLWKSDGTDSGTVRIKPGYFGEIFPIPGTTQAVLAGSDGLTGIELWVTDGTTEGTRLLQDINPGPTSSNPERFRLSGDYVYFMADDGVHGQEPWVLSLIDLGITPQITVPAEACGGDSVQLGGGGSPSLPFLLGGLVAVLVRRRLESVRAAQH